MKKWSLNYVSIAMIIPYIAAALANQVEGTAEVIVVAVGVIVCCINLVKSIIGIIESENAALLAVLVSIYSIFATLWLGL